MISCVIKVFHVSSKANDITVGMLGKTFLVHEFENVEEVFGNVMVFLQKQDGTFSRKAGQSSSN